MPNEKTAIFLDRDGTIIVDKNYLKSPAEVELLNGAAEAIQLLKKNNYMLFLFSNQSGISRKLLTMEDVVACNTKMIELLGAGTDVFQEICIAHELPADKPIYRKPSPRFIFEMIEKYSLKNGNCYMVGDKGSDVLTGINAGINAILIPGEKEVLIDKKSFKNFHSILEFANWLLSSEL